jgi:hypothetical protein
MPLNGVFTQSDVFSETCIRWWHLVSYDTTQKLGLILILWVVSYNTCHVGLCK